MSSPRLVRGLFIIWVVSLLRFVASQECHQFGPVLPRPTLTKSIKFSNATQRLADVLNSAVNGSAKSGWDVPNTSFSVAFMTRDQPDGDVPEWEYHHVASNSSSGTKTVNRDSQYLIGSISKVMTVAVLLRVGADLDSPITKYVPELGDGASRITWSNITLRALASHMAGIPANLGGLSEYYFLQDYAAVLGLPELSEHDYAPCDVRGLNPSCAKTDILQGLMSAHAVAPPMERPVYSNVAFNLLSYALQDMTGKPYSELLVDYLTDPFNMTNTYPSPGNSTQGVIPSVPYFNSWGVDYGEHTPAGGLVSTVSDLSILLHSLLSHTTLHTPTAVRQWLQPHSFLGSLYSGFGMPWETFRVPPEAVFPVDDPGHIITMVKKDGIAVGYRSRLAILDEYGAGFVILTAGDTGAMSVISNALLKTLAPVIDEIARDQTQELGYAETFTERCNGTLFNATFSLDDKGLRITSLFRNQTDIVAMLKLVYASTLGMLARNFLVGPDSILRLYPAEVSSTGVVGNRTVVREDWRLVWDNNPEVVSELPGQDISDFDCRSWETVDLLYYGNEPVDRIVFVKDFETGKVLGLEVPFLRSNGTIASSCWKGQVRD